MKSCVLEIERSEDGILCETQMDGTPILHIARPKRQRSESARPNAGAFISIVQRVLVARKDKGERIEKLPATYRGRLKGISWHTTSWPGRSGKFRASVNAGRSQVGGSPAIRPSGWESVKWPNLKDKPSSPDVAVALTGSVRHYLQPVRSRIRSCLRTGPGVRNADMLNNL